MQEGSPCPPCAPISYSVVGNGPEHVLFLAGMCMTRDAWHPQVDFFAQDPRFTLILPDNRGVGESPAAQGYDLDIMARDAWAVVDKVAGVAGTVHIIGHSMGAMIASRAALQAPTRTRSLALLSGHSGGWWWSHVPSVGLSIAAVSLALLGWTATSVANASICLHYSDSFLDELIVDDLTGAKSPRRVSVLSRYLDGAMLNSRTDPDGAVFWGQLAAIRRYELNVEECALLKAAAFPVAVVYGEQDQVITPAASRELAERIGADCFRVPGKHFIADESSYDVNHILLYLFKYSAKPQTNQEKLREYALGERSDALSFDHFDSLTAT